MRPGGPAIQWWNGRQKEVARGRQWWMGSVWSHRLSVKHTLHLFLVPLPFKEHQQALHNSVAYWRGGRWGTQRWSALIKVCVLERWIKSKQHEMILTFVVWTWEHLCMLVRVCACVCVTWQIEKVSAGANKPATQGSQSRSDQGGLKMLDLIVTMWHNWLVTFILLPLLFISWI